MTLSLLTNLRRWRMYSRTVRELSSLSDRELNDLGISRGSIRGIAWTSTH